MHKSYVYQRSVIIVLLFLITLFCCPDPAGTQDIRSSISGVITDEDTNQPVPYVNVFLTNTTMGASTDARGSYLISDIPVSKVPCGISFLHFPGKTAMSILSYTRERCKA